MERRALSQPITALRGVPSVDWATSAWISMRSGLDPSSAANTAAPGDDVYLNVAGGLKINEPGADLAVAAALISSLSGLALPANCVYFGEVSLSGAIRPVAQAQSRLKEAEKLGFDQAICPEGNLKDGAASSFKASGLSELGDFVAKLSAEASASKGAEA